MIPWARLLDTAILPVRPAFLVMLAAAILLHAFVGYVDFLDRREARVYERGYEAGFGAGASRSVSVLIDGKVARGLAGRPLWVTAEVCEDTARTRRARGILP